MNKRLKAFITMGTSSAFQVLLNLVKTKYIAIMLGTYGMGITSYINNIIGTITAYTNLGLNNGIIKEISANKDEKEKINKIINSVYCLTSLVALVSVLILIIFPSLLNLKLINIDLKYVYFATIFIAVLSTTITMISTAIINGFSEIKFLGTVNVLSNIAALIINVIAIFYYGLSGAIFSIALTSLSTSLLFIYYVSRSARINDIKLTYKISNVKFIMLKPLFKYGAVVITTSLMTNYSMLFMRKIIINSLGIEYNGLFQSIWAMCNQYLSLVLSSLGVYYLPTLCSKRNNNEIIEEINSTLSLILKVVLPIIIMVTLFRNLAMNVLYSHEFNTASKYIPIFLIADYFKVIFWTLSMPIYSLPNFKLQIISEILYDLIMILMPLLLINKLGMFSIGLGYLISQIILVIFILISFKKIISLKINRKNKKLILSSIGVLLIITTAVYVLGNIQVIILACFLLIFWAKLNISKSELNEIINTLKKRG
ncbi:polysaccharide biosynthesis protein [Clostridiales bacterium oral taxon 876 str. F0540]|nr:polysaccharide biosynthesis protein [Clostridiales bacterium oral taxon 876 str. F0540]